jgi:hypothetical protein
MLDILIRSRDHAATVLLLAVVGALASGCAGQLAPEPLPDRPAVRVEPTSTTPIFAFEDPGTNHHG